MTYVDRDLIGEYEVDRSSDQKTADISRGGANSGNCDANLAAKFNRMLLNVEDRGPIY